LGSLSTNQRTEKEVERRCKQLLAVTGAVAPGTFAVHQRSHESREVEEIAIHQTDEVVIQCEGSQEKRKQRRKMAGEEEGAEEREMEKMGEEGMAGEETALPSTFATFGDVRQRQPQGRGVFS
jgi:hypothetical protein